jgi:hypothetical protein
MSDYSMPWDTIFESLEGRAGEVELGAREAQGLRHDEPGQALARYSSSVESLRQVARIVFMLQLLGTYPDDFPVDRLRRLARQVRNTGERLQMEASLVRFRLQDTEIGTGTGKPMPTLPTPCSNQLCMMICEWINDWRCSTDPDCIRMICDWECCP